MCACVCGRGWRTSLYFLGKLFVSRNCQSHCKKRTRASDWLQCCNINRIRMDTCVHVVLCIMNRIRMDTFVHAVLCIMNFCIFSRMRELPQERERELCFEVRQIVAIALLPLLQTSLQFREHYTYLCALQHTHDCTANYAVLWQVVHSLFIFSLT